MALSLTEWIIVGLVLVFPVLYQFSHRIRFYAKMFAFEAWIMASPTLVLPIALFHPGDIKNLSYVQWLMQQTLPMWGVEVEIRNKENLTFDKPRVIVCNHQSSIDLISMVQILPPRSSVLIKKELLYAGLFGVTSWLCGLVFVDRSNRSKAQETMEKTARIMHERNLNIWIYPEGTRNFDGHLLPFKKGAFHLAVQAKVPIYPLVFSSYRDFLSKKDKIFNPGKVLITCLPAVSTEGLTSEDVTGLTERVFASMNSVYQSSSSEIHEQAKLAGTSLVVD